MELAIIIIYVFLYIIAIYKMEYAIFFYIFFFTIRDVVDVKLFGLMGLNAVFIFILFYHFFRRGFVSKLFIVKSNLLKYLMLFTFSFITIEYLNDIRQTFLLEEYLQENITFLKIFSDTLKYCITAINIAVLIKFSLAIPRNRVIAYRAIILSIIAIILTIYFAPILESIGIDARGIQEKDLAIDKLDRISGLFMGGDVNALSATIVLTIGIIFINSIINNRRLYVVETGVILFLCTGVFLAASRMGFATLIFIFFYYLVILQFKNRNIDKKIILNTIFILIGAFIVLFLINSNDKFQLVFYRISDQGMIREIQSEGDRYIRWIGFIKFSFENTIRAIFGSNELYYAFGFGEYRDPHNFFIRTLYLNGVFVLMFFVYCFYKLFDSLKKMRLNKYNLLLIIPVFISLMIISQTTFIYFYLIYIGCLIHQVVLKNDGLVYST